jgi:hypothetical protein
MDVTKFADWKSAMDAAIQIWGKVDILVNNAGTSYRNKPTAEVTEEEFQKTFDVNVKGVFLGCQAWVHQVIERKEGGVIINIASVGASRPRPGLVWYNASKGAITNVGCVLGVFIMLYCMLTCPGDKRIGSRVWAAPNPGKQYLSTSDRNRSLFAFHWHGRYPRQSEEVHIQCTDGTDW